MDIHTENEYLKYLKYKIDGIDLMLSLQSSHGHRHKLLQEKQRGMIFEIGIIMKIIFKKHCK